MAIKVNNKKTAGIGPSGPQGRSAYQTAVLNGYLNTESEFGTSLSCVGSNMKSFEFSITLSASGWSNNEQNVSSEYFIKDGYHYIVRPSMENFTDCVTFQIRANDVDADGQMTFYCENVPNKSLVFDVLRMEVEVAMT